MKPYKKKQLARRLREQEQEAGTVFGVQVDDGIDLEQLREDLQDLLRSLNKGVMPKTDATHALHQIIELLDAARKEAKSDDPDYNYTPECLRERIKYDLPPRSSEEQAARLLLD